MTAAKRDHGGGIDAAAARYGGRRIDWIDLSTGINPEPYALPDFPPDAWTALPDKAAQEALTSAARAFWQVPVGADIIAAPGASSLISKVPDLAPKGAVTIPAPTYNEHAAAFELQGWKVQTKGPANAQVVVNPNNPDGTIWNATTFPAANAALTIIDESFCDICPSNTLIQHSANSGTIVLKSFGKFWGLAGLRLGFAIGDPCLIGKLRNALGPWPVAGPALHIGTCALNDPEWALHTRERLARNSLRLDRLMTGAGAEIAGGTTLFRLYSVDNAEVWQTRLAEHRIWSRVFPYSSNWVRLGLPKTSQWSRLEAAVI